MTMIILSLICMMAFSILDAIMDSLWFYKRVWEGRNSKLWHRIKPFRISLLFVSGYCLGVLNLPLIELGFMVFALGIVHWITFETTLTKLRQRR